MSADKSLVEAYPLGCWTYLFSWHFNPQCTNILATNKQAMTWYAKSVRTGKRFQFSHIQKISNSILRNFFCTPIVWAKKELIPKGQLKDLKVFVMVSKIITLPNSPRKFRKKRSQASLMEPKEVVPIGVSFQESLEQIVTEIRIIKRIK